MEVINNVILLFRATELSWGWIAFLVLASIFFLYILVISILVIIGSVATFWIFRKTSLEDVYTVIRSNSLPPITFIIPAYNEVKLIVHTVKNLLSLSYRYKKIIIVNDGSTDETLEVLKLNFSLVRVPPSCPGTLKTAKVRGFYVSEDYPNLLVIDKENGNKADALNAGLNACETEAFVAADADTFVDDNALNRLIRPFLLYPNTTVSYASIGILNGCKLGRNRILEFRFPDKLLAGTQALEYVRNFFIERMGLIWTKGALVVPGSFGLFQKKIVVDLGGYDVTSLVEDTEIITHMHDYCLSNNIEYNITYLPDRIAWTAAPETVKGLVRQRLRWIRGTTQNTWRYRHMLFRPKYRTIGMVVFPLTIFEKIAPIFEVAGLTMLFISLLIAANVSLVIAIALAIWLYVSLINVVTILIDTLVFNSYKTWKDFGRIFVATVLYGYHHYILFYCRFRGFHVPEDAQYSWIPDRSEYKRFEQSDS